MTQRAKNTPTANSVPHKLNRKKVTTCVCILQEYMHTFPILEIMVSSQLRLETAVVCEPPCANCKRPLHCSSAQNQARLGSFSVVGRLDAARPTLRGTLLARVHPPNRNESTVCDRVPALSHISCVVCCRWSSETTWSSNRNKFQQFHRNYRS